MKMNIEVITNEKSYGVWINGRFLQIPKDNLTDVINVLEFWFLVEHDKDPDLAELINLLTEKEA